MKFWNMVDFCMATFRYSKYGVQPTVPPGGAIRVYCVDPSLYNPCGVVEDAELVDEALSRDRAHLSLNAMIDIAIFYDWLNNECTERERAFIAYDWDEVSWLKQAAWNKRRKRLGH